MGICISSKNEVFDFEASECVSKEELARRTKERENCERNIVDTHYDLATDQCVQEPAYRLTFPFGPNDSGNYPKFEENLYSLRFDEDAGLSLGSAPISTYDLGYRRYDSNLGWQADQNPGIDLGKVWRFGADFSESRVRRAHPESDLSAEEIRGARLTGGAIATTATIGGLLFIAVLGSAAMTSPNESGMMISTEARQTPEAESEVKKSEDDHK